MLIKRKRSGYHGGFTIVEIIIVIVAIAILAALVSVSYGSIGKESAKSSVKTALASAQQVLDMKVMRGLDVTTDLPDDFRPPKDVIVEVVPPGHYGNLSDVQNGVLFHDICVELVAIDQYTVIHPKSGSGSDKVITGCPINTVSRSSMAIHGWDSRSWPTPVQRSQLTAYIASVPYDSWWTDRQSVVRGFYTELINRFESRGGKWPITSFWDHWANDGNGGVKRDSLPILESPEIQRYCVQAVHQKYPDVVYSIASQNVNPQEGACNS